MAEQASPLRILQVALGVSLVCALVVSLTAVSLRPHYLANLEAERMARLASILDALDDVSVSKNPEDIEARVVELESGRYSEVIDPLSYDVRRAANDPAKNFSIPVEQDLAGIKRRARHAVVYLLRDNSDQVDVLILPVRGVGYQSALYGFLALSGDANEILGLKFYEHGETPGLGSQIQDPSWEALWPGKMAFDEAGRVIIRVGGSRSAGGERIDGISGATRTSNGVDRLIRFWLGDFGFGPYLNRVRKGEG
ncbi:MAG: Na(+)-translocating NADH-quinone reductase subunit C [Gammaproteobacteria bacterium]|nr:Na(+)-translocating NADH-quinone reductase subunit C [Gammaproteobacteria bacterium]